MADLAGPGIVTQEALKEGETRQVSRATHMSQAELPKSHAEQVADCVTEQNDASTMSLGE